MEVDEEEEGLQEYVCVNCEFALRQEHCVKSVRSLSFIYTHGFSLHLLLLFL